MDSTSRVVEDSGWVSIEFQLKSGEKKVFGPLDALDVGFRLDALKMEFDVNSVDFILAIKQLIQDLGGPSPGEISHRAAGAFHDTIMAEVLSWRPQKKTDEDQDGENVSSESI